MQLHSLSIHIISYSENKICSMVSSYYIDQKKRKEKKRDPFLSFRYFSHGIVRASAPLLCCAVGSDEKRWTLPSTRAPVTPSLGDATAVLA